MSEKNKNMSEKNKNIGFWALLITIGGGAVWAINKFIVSPTYNPTKNTTNKRVGIKTTNSSNTNTSSSSTTTNTTTPNNTTSSTITAPTTNGATKNGMPFNIDITKIKFNLPDELHSWDFSPTRHIDVVINQSGVYKDSNGKTYSVINFEGIYYLIGSTGKVVYGYTKEGVYNGQQLYNSLENEIRDARNPFGGGSCFIEGTKIKMSNGSVKDIQDILIGDCVIGKDSKSNKVIEINTFEVNDGIFGFNDIKPFVTATHPFFTKKGWKSIERNFTHKDISVDILEIEDEILTFDDSYLKIENISEEHKGEIVVYSLTLDGDKTYYANDLCVHNKQMIKVPHTHSTSISTKGNPLSPTSSNSGEGEGETSSS